MSRFWSTVSLALAAWFGMTSIAAAEAKCDIKQKLETWTNKAGTPAGKNKQDVLNVLKGYRDLQASITTYREEMFGGQGAKDAYIKKVGEDGRAFRQSIAGFIAESDIVAGVNDPKCYICIIRRSYTPASRIFEKCKNAMKIIKSSTLADDRFSTLPELEKCTRVDAASGELSRQDLQDPKLDYNFWSKMSDTIKLLDDQVTAWQAANALEANQATMLGILDIFIGQYITLKTQHDAHNRNDKLPSDMGPPGLQGLEQICPGYSSWIQTGK